MDGGGSTTLLTESQKSLSIPFVTLSLLEASQ